MVFKSIIFINFCDPNGGNSNKSGFILRISTFYHIKIANFQHFTSVNECLRVFVKDKLKFGKEEKLFQSEKML